MKRKRSLKFLKNQDATAEIVGTVLLIIILIFFFGNVFLWNNETNKIADQMKWNKMNSHYKRDPAEKERNNGFLRKAGLPD